MQPGFNCETLCYPKKYFLYLLSKTYFNYLTEISIIYFKKTV